MNDTTSRRTEDIHADYMKTRTDLRSRLAGISEALDAAENGDISKLDQVNSLQFVLVAYDNAYELGVAYGSAFTAAKMLNGDLSDDAEPTEADAR